MLLSGKFGRSVFRMSLGNICGLGRLVHAAGGRYVAGRPEFSRLPLNPPAGERRCDIRVLQAWCIGDTGG